MFFLRVPNPRRERSDSRGLFRKKMLFFLRVPNPRRERSHSRGLFIIVRRLFRRLRRAFLRFISKISHFAADPEYFRAQCLSVMESITMNNRVVNDRLSAKRCGGEWPTTWVSSSHKLWQRNHEATTCYCMLLVNAAHGSAWTVTCGSGDHEAAKCAFILFC